jgi:hypothetical protein
LSLVALMLLAVLAMLLAVGGCGSPDDQGPVAGEATVTEAPPEPPPEQDRCGDGVCDEVEQKNPTLCPEDCPPPPTPTPTPTSELPQDLCGDGICDEEEQKQPDLCPQDCAGGAPDEPGSDEPGGDEPGGDEPGGDDEPPAPPVDTFPSRARLWLKWRSAYGGCPGQQVDDLFAEMEFSLDLTEDGSLTGTGEGTLYAEPVSRCPDTDYGGLRTPDPYAVTITSTLRTITGTATSTGWMVSVTAQDRSEAYFSSGATYHEECVLCWVMPQFKGNGIQGDATHFGLPRELLPGDSFLFEMDYQIPQGSWVNTHVGEGRVEILEMR